ncbi:MAG: hypothetical protein WCB44_01090, partial [Stellaceae bacterium]
CIWRRCSGMNVSVRDEKATDSIGAGLHRTPQFILRKAGGLCLVLSALAPAGGYQSSWGTLLLV